MPNRKNTDRATKALKALHPYMEKENPNQADRIRTAMVDAIADMAHLAGFFDIDFDQAVRTALDHAGAEKREQPL